MKYPFNCLFFFGVYKSSPLISCTYLLIQFLVSTVKCFLCKAGVLSYSLLLCLQGIFWKFELHRGGQKLIIPVRIFSLFLLFHFKMHPFSSIPVRIGWIEWKAIRTFGLCLSNLLLMGYILQILLSRHLNPVFATGAFILPTSLYFVLKVIAYCKLFTVFLFIHAKRISEKMRLLIILYKAY